MSKSRKYAFTYFATNPSGLGHVGQQAIDPSIEEAKIVEDLRCELEQKLDTCKMQMQLVYYVFQIERAPDTGRFHGQGYMRFSNAVRIRTLKKHLSSTAHFEACAGSETQNFEYCTKVASRVAGPFEFGTRQKGQGSRSDLSRARSLLLAGKTIKDIVFDESITSYQAMRGAEMMLKYLDPPDRKDMVFHWHHGSTGSGKTRTVWEFAKEKNLSIWANSKDGEWFDGYWGQQVALIDDFRPTHFPFAWLLRVTDRNPLRVPVKSSFTPWRPKYLFVTCPYSIAECYKFRSDEDIDQLERRVRDSGGQERLFGTPVVRPICAKGMVLSAYHNKQK